MQRNETAPTVHGLGDYSVRSDEEHLYWKIPRDKISINDFLVRSGYRIKETQENYGNDDVYATNPKGHETNKVGLISKNSSLITVLYGDYSLLKIQDQLEFRDLLDHNGIEYAESPPREIAAEKFREYSKKLSELADKVEEE